MTTIAAPDLSGASGLVDWPDEGLTVGAKALSKVDTEVGSGLEVDPTALEAMKKIYEDAAGDTGVIKEKSSIDIGSKAVADATDFAQKALSGAFE